MLLEETHERRIHDDINARFAESDKKYQQTTEQKTELQNTTKAQIDELQRTSSEGMQQLMELIKGRQPQKAAEYQDDHRTQTHNSHLLPMAEDSSDSTSSNDNKSHKYIYVLLREPMPEGTKATQATRRRLEEEGATLLQLSHWLSGGLRGPNSKMAKKEAKYQKKLFGVRKTADTIAETKALRAELYDIGEVTAPPHSRIRQR